MLLPRLFVDHVFVRLHDGAIKECVITQYLSTTTICCVPTCPSEPLEEYVVNLSKVYLLDPSGPWGAVPITEIIDDELSEDETTELTRGGSDVDSLQEEV